MEAVLFQQRGTYFKNMDLFGLCLEAERVSLLKCSLLIWNGAAMLTPGCSLTLLRDRVFCGFVGADASVPEKGSFSHTIQLTRFPVIYLKCTYCTLYTYDLAGETCFCEWSGQTSLSRRHSSSSLSSESQHWHLNHIMGLD